MGRREWTKAIALGSAVVALAGCGSDDPATSSLSVVDSAGVEIVIHGPATMAALPAWRLAPEPLWSAGQVDGPLAFTRVVDVQPLASGAVVVLDGVTNRVHVLDPEGRLRATVGGTGDGPGEFRAPTRLLPLAADTFGVWDSRPRRVSEFGADGGLTRVVPVDLPHGTSEGPTLVRVGSGYAAQAYGSMSDIEGTRGRPSTEAFAVARDGTVLGSYGAHPGMEYFRGEGLVGRAVLGATPLSVGRDEEFILGAAETPELRVFDSDRRLRQVVRWPDRDRTVTDEMFESVLAGQVELAPADQRANVEEMLRRGLVHAERFPPYNDLTSDEGGRLWVGRDRRPEERIHFTSAPEAEWLIFGPDGVAEARMTTPAGLRVMAVAVDRIYGVRTDDLGIPRVEVYRWTTGGS